MTSTYLHGSNQKEESYYYRSIIMTLEGMSALSLRFILRHSHDYPKEYVEAAQQEIMARRLGIGRVEES